jgi:hypothetical protein
MRKEQTTNAQHFKKANSYCFALGNGFRGIFSSRCAASYTNAATTADICLRSSAIK